MKYKSKEQLKQYLLKRSLINTDTDCIEWQGALNDAGYPNVHVASMPNYPDRTWHAHRLMYTVLYGDVPNDMFVCHTCDNPKCINPKHLFLGTHQDNMRDMVNKGRQSTKGGTPFPKGHKIWVGRKHTKETKAKISAAGKKWVGAKNSQYGTCWIYNAKLQENKKIDKGDLSHWLNKGWHQGRKMKF